MVLAGYEIEPERIDFVADLDCIVFRVKPKGHRHDYMTLRFYPSYYGGSVEISHELCWLRALSRETDLLTPEPIAARDGSLVQTLNPKVHDIDSCVLLSWVPGRFFDKGLTPGRLQQVGVFTGRLHNHSEQFTAVYDFPATRLAYLPELSRWAQYEAQRPEWFSKRDLTVLASVAVTLQEELDSLGRDGGEYGLIHGDLHLLNYLFHRGRAGAIDFSDCGWGHFAHDIAAALVFVQYLPDWSKRDRAEYSALRDAYVKGYRSVRGLPRDWERSMPIYLAIRLFTMLDWMTYHWPSIDYLPWGQRAVATSVEALQNFLATAEYLR